MKTSVELVQHCRRQWWWSPEPFWQYLNHGQGWANFVDIHPGMFNLAWRLSGVQGPPAHYAMHAETNLWVLQEAPKIRLQGGSLPDAALKLSWPAFREQLAGRPELLRTFRLALSA